MWVPNKYHKRRVTPKTPLLLKETPVDWSRMCLWVAWRHHLSLSPFVFLQILQLQNGNVNLYEGGTWWHFLGWCSLNQRNNNMLSASAETFDSHSAHAALPRECQQTSPSSPGWHWACQTSHSTSMFSETIHISPCRATRQLLLDISIICTRFDLTKAIQCQWHLASASGDRQVRKASRQHTGPGGIAKVGAV